MTLYHFTSGRHLPGILDKGLTKGVLPWRVDKEARVGFVPGWQWLTSVSGWSQEWARPSPFSTLPFRRDEIRITVQFPAAFRGELGPWPELDRKYRPESREFLNSFADAKEWSAFHGQIPPAWFLSVDRNPHPEVVIDVGAN